MIKQWKIREKLHPKLTEHLLASRGIKEKKDKEKFLYPDYDNHLEDPFLLKGMSHLINRFIKALKEEELIGVFSDYDADGVCSAAIISDFFRAIGYKKYFIYIPDRNKEGYGLSKNLVTDLKNKGTTLLFTLDSGISNFDEIARATELGLDVLVVDHHEPPAILPPAFAIINPKQVGETYSFHYFCTAGLMFKIICAVISKSDFGLPKSWEKWLLDFVAVATIADMVPMIGENRLLVHYGLKVLRRNRRPGFSAILEGKRLWSSNLTEEDISFSIAPSINLAGRMAHAKESLDLLLTSSIEEARNIVLRLNDLSLSRKEAVQLIMDSVGEVTKKGQNPKVIVVGHPSWHPGVLGLAANKVVEKYGCTAFLWGQGSGQNAKGSCRTDGAVDVVALMRALPKNLLDEFGGHKSAGGFALPLARVSDLEKFIQEAYESLKSDEIDDFSFADAELILDEITWEKYREIDVLSPFGKENPKPVFILKNILIDEVKNFGTGKAHTRLVFANSKAEKISAVGFFSRPRFWGVKEKVQPGSRINLLASLEVESYRGSKDLRLRIVDVQ